MTATASSRCYAPLLIRCWEILRTDPAGLWPRTLRVLRRRRKDAVARRAEAAKRVEFAGPRWSHDGPVSLRIHESYESYLAVQREKLELIGGEAFVDPNKAVAMFLRRFKTIDSIPPGARILGLGARRGEEVRAWRDLGHFAFGLDLNPGKDNKWVTTGDFHFLHFPAHSVDLIYTNCLDHVYDLGLAVEDVVRVLAPGGLFVADILYGHQEGFTVGPHDTAHWPTARGFAEHLAERSGFQLLSFTDLASVGSAFWTQAVLRKSAERAAV